MVKNNIEPMGKVPPHALEIEEAVLGALMLEGKEALETVGNILTSSSFYSDANQKIFAAIQSLAAQNKPVDMLVVTQELKAKSQLEAIGGPYYISELTSRVASAANIEHHARIITQKHMQREVIRIASELLRGGYDETIDVADLLNHAEKSFSGVLDKAGSDIDAGTEQQDVIHEAIDQIKEDCKNTAKGIVSGISTGFDTLDRIIGGWKAGTLTILAARPGIGKTSLALHFAKVAAENGKSVLFFSLEMTKTDLVKILISGEACIDRTRLRDGRLDSNDWQLLDQSIGSIERFPIKWIDRAGINVNQIKTAIKKNRKAGKCDLVVIDYLQLIAPTDKKVIREQQISEISRILKEITLNEKIPIICLSQLNREAESEVPKASHLRESGAIEQDADIILLPWRPGYNGGVSENTPIPENEIKLIVAKNRRGQRGDFKLFANAQMTAFREDNNDNRPF